MKSRSLLIALLPLFVSCTISEIHYTSSNEKKIKANKDAFNKTIISNTYRGGKGVIKFIGKLEEIRCAPFDTAQIVQSNAAEQHGSLVSISLPNGMTIIGDDVFRGFSNLKEISMPNTISFIGKNTFRDCNSLEYIKLPQDIRSIADGLFMGCGGLKCISLPQGVVSVGKGSFDGCSSIETVDLPQGLKSIKDNCFSGCTNLKNIIIPNTIRSIGVSAFANSGLSSITIPEKVATIGANALSNCVNLREVMMSSCNITHICDSVFNGCINLESIIIPNTVESIGVSAFANSGLSSITIPESVTTIGANALSNCVNLKDVYINTDGILVNKSVISGSYNIDNLYIDGCRYRHGWREWNLTIEKDYNAFTKWISKIKWFYDSENTGLSLDYKDGHWSMFISGNFHDLEYYSRTERRVNFLTIDPQLYITIGVSILTDGRVILQIGREDLWFNSDYI